MPVIENSIPIRKIIYEFNSDEYLFCGIVSLSSFNGEVTKEFHGETKIELELLQEIRDALDNESSGWDSRFADLRDKLDSIYPFLNQSK